VCLCSQMLFTGDGGSLSAHHKPKAYGTSRTTRIIRSVLVYTGPYWRHIHIHTTPITVLILCHILSRMSARLPFPVERHMCAVEGHLVRTTHACQACFELGRRGVSSLNASQQHTYVLICYIITRFPCVILPREDCFTARFVWQTCQDLHLCYICHTNVSLLLHLCYIITHTPQRSTLTSQHFAKFF
jgi:hypothetical protein